jgi:hypothetical protein
MPVPSSPRAGLFLVQLGLGAGYRDGAAAMGGPGARGPPGSRAPAACCIVRTYAQLSSCVRFFGCCLGSGAGCRDGAAAAGGPGARGPSRPGRMVYAVFYGSMASSPLAGLSWMRLGVRVGDSS